VKKTRLVCKKCVWGDMTLSKCGNIFPVFRMYEIFIAKRAQVGVQEFVMFFFWYNKKSHRHMLNYIAYSSSSKDLSWAVYLYGGIND
jgi:hypothetical protein